MGWMQDRVPTYPSTGNKTASGIHCVCLYFIMYFYLLIEAESQLHIAWQSYKRKTCGGLLHSSSFILLTDLLSWVLCDCNWLESLKLASPCQPMKALKSWGLIQLSSLPKPNRFRARSLQSSEHSRSAGFAPVTIHHPLEFLVLDGGFVWGPFFSITEAYCRMNRFWTN